MDFKNKNDHLRWPFLLETHCKQCRAQSVRNTKEEYRIAPAKKHIANIIGAILIARCPQKITL